MTRSTKGMEPRFPCHRLGGRGQGRTGARGGQRRQRHTNRRWGTGWRFCPIIILSYALLWVLIVSLLSYILLFLVSWMFCECYFTTVIYNVMTIALSYCCMYTWNTQSVAAEVGQGSSWRNLFSALIYKNIVVSLSKWLAPIHVC
jgi:hypothetical protein